MYEALLGATKNGATRLHFGRDYREIYHDQDPPHAPRVLPTATTANPVNPARAKTHRPDRKRATESQTTEQN